MRWIFCRGGWRTHLQVVLKAGWEYGFRSDYTPYHDKVAFIDFPFHKGDEAIGRHLTRVMRYKPSLAMVQDWEAHIEYDSLILQHQVITSDGTAIWTPKQHGVVHRIPSEAVIGVSVPTPEYAGFLPNPKEVGSRPVHLLGGEPDAQRYLMDVYNVQSLDMNSFVRMAGYGRYWNKDRWVQTKREFSTGQLIEKSAVGILDYLRGKYPPFYNKRRKALQRIWSIL